MQNRRLPILHFAFLILHFLRKLHSQIRYKRILLLRYQQLMLPRVQQLQPSSHIHQPDA
jgi:hypothetical protein